VALQELKLLEILFTAKIALTLIKNTFQYLSFLQEEDEQTKLK